MTAAYKIGILGIGGVGAYLANKLVKKYNESKEYEIYIITRPNSKPVLETKGIKLISSDDEEIVYPKNIVADTSIIGQLDLILICVKSYDIVDAIKIVKPCIGKQTIIIPFLNGADITERIKSLIPEANAINGCVYIVSRLIEPGVVKLFSNIIQFYIGDENNRFDLTRINNCLIEAGINCAISPDIKKTIWEKFIFISPFATLTSYLDKPIGAIFRDEAYKSLMKSLIEEIVKLARIIKINFDDNIVEVIMSRMQMVPYETTSSMHSDFEKAHKTELITLTEYVVILGNELNVPTPTYTKMLEVLKEKTLNQKT